MSLGTEWREEPERSHIQRRLPSQQAPSPQVTTTEGKNKKSSKLLPAPYLSSQRPLQRAREELTSLCPLVRVQQSPRCSALSPDFPLVALHLFLLHNFLFFLFFHDRSEPTSGVSEGERREREKWMELERKKIQRNTTCPPPDSLSAML